MLVEDRSARALYDPGANISLINDDFIKDKEKIIPLRPYACKTMGGVRLLTGVIRLKLKIKKIQKDIIWFFVVKDENFTYDTLIGLDCFQIFRLNLDYKLNITQTEEEEKGEDNQNNFDKINNIPTN